MAALARLRMAVLCLLVLLLVAASCEDPRVVGVTIDSGAITLAVGEMHSLTASADARGGASPAIEWLSANAGVATVTSEGVVQGVAEGATEIMARSVFDPSKHDEILATVVASSAQTMLTVTREGFGAGTVTSDPAGIDCGAACAAAFAQGTSVTLTAAAASGSLFFGWSGACSGMSSTCTVSMTEARSVTATFVYEATPIRPANDDFANHIAVTGVSGSTTGTNVHATKETGEPNHAGQAGGASVWWSWTAPSSGWVRFDTVGSDFDTLLGVYTGSAVNALTHVASNDDDDGTINSRVTFYASAGVAYRIAVDGWGSATGSVVLRWGGPLAPANDDFAMSGYLSGTSGSRTGLNVAATKEAGEPSEINPGGSSVWWTWTAPATGWVAFDTDGSDFDTLLGVYTGSVVNALTFVGWNDDATGMFPRSRVVFAAVADVAYRIVVDGYDGDQGNIVLNWGATVAPTAPPSNDDLANAIVLRGTSGTTSGSNVNATEQEFEPNHAGNMAGRSVWWAWTAPAGGVVTITTAGSDFDTLLAVYTGTSVTALTPIASNDDYGGTPQSRVDFAAAAGTTYRIAVDGYRYGSGDIDNGIVKLNWSQ